MTQNRHEQVVGLEVKARSCSTLEASVPITDVERRQLTWLRGFDSHTVEAIAAMITVPGGAHRRRSSLDAVPLRRGTRPGVAPRDIGGGNHLGDGSGAWWMLATNRG
ncbi:MAG: hypothetical protein ACRDRA_13195 [Pseudonocardiaceae bacterium]